MKLKIEKSLAPSLTSQIMVPIGATFLALVFCAIFLVLTGRDPMAVYSAMFLGALGSEYGISETFVKFIPLAICALGISVAFRMQLWNIGAEGQFYMGACFATWVPLNFPNLPWYIMLPIMMIAAVIGGGLLGLLAAWLKTKWLVNEIISTLMLNYIAILWVDYLVFGMWKDPEGMNFPLTAAFPDAARIPVFGDFRVHYGILFVLIIAVLFYFLFKDSKWGYETLIIGQNPTAARYAGINITKNVLVAMAISGAVCGFAGMVEVSGVVGKLQHGISPGYGYTAIIIAWLARLNPPAILIVAFFFAIIHVGGFMIQTMGIPSATSTMLQGAILFFVVGADILTNYEIKLVKGAKKMSEALLISILAAAITAGTPILFAALGELITERAGVLNLGVDGIMLVGAATGFMATVTYGSPWIGVAVALAAGALMSLIHAFLTVTLRANQVVSGLALGIFGTGLSGYLGKDYVGVRAEHIFTKLPIPGLSDIPFIGPIMFKQDVLVYISYLLIPLAAFFLYKTKNGLFLRALGENPAAIDAVGVSVFKLRYIYTMIGGALAGLGGAYLSLAYAPSWLENMTAGRGWIAVALVIFALWDPWRALMGSYLFGGIDALGFHLQVIGVHTSIFLLNMLPYIFTIVVLVLVIARKGGRLAAPKALGIPYDREER